MSICVCVLLASPIVQYRGVHQLCYSNCYLLTSSFTLQYSLKYITNQSSYISS